jgi:hypothetical protein
MQHLLHRLPTAVTRQWMIPMAPEPDSRLDVVTPSWRGADLRAGDTCCWSNRPLRCPRSLLATIAQTTPFVEGNRYPRYPHDGRDAAADTHAPGFQREPLPTTPRRCPACGQEYEAWPKTPPGPEGWVHVWADGASPHWMWLSAVIGVDARGEKRFLAIEDGPGAYRVVARGAPRPHEAGWRRPRWR